MSNPIYFEDYRKLRIPLYRYIKRKDVTIDMANDVEGEGYKNADSAKILLKAFPISSQKFRIYVAGGTGGEFRILRVHCPGC